MNADPDIVGLRSELLLVRAKLEGTRARHAKWRDELVNATSISRRSQITHTLKLTSERVAILEVDARKLETEIEKAENALRKHDDEAPVTAPQSGMRLFAVRTLDLGGKRYGRGAEIDPNEFATFGNRDRLLQGRHVEWRYPSTPKAAAPTATNVAVANATPDDPLVNFARLVQTISITRSISWVEAEEAAQFSDNNLFLRAQSAFCALPRLTRDGGWGSSGGSLVMNGVASAGRRVFNVSEFRDHLRAIVEPQPQEAA
jgi:hypothetical protein